MSALPLPATSAPRAGYRPGTPAAIDALKRIRWAVRATLLLGVAASVAANILHAPPHLVSQIIAGWPPVALLLTVELISRVPVHRRLLAAARLIATTAIAGITAWVSYWHMVGVTARYGETGPSAYLLPLSVDGLVIVASISLVELTGRLHTEQTPDPAVPPPSEDRPGTTRTSPASERPRSSPAPPNPAATHRPGPARATSHSGDAPPDPHAGHQPAAPDNNPDHAPPRGHDPAGQTPRRRHGSTRQAVIDAHRQDPNLHPTAIARTLGTSERTVRRYLHELHPDNPHETSPNHPKRP